MAETAGPSGADGGAWPSRPPSGPPEPPGQPGFVGSAPTDPEIPRTLEAPTPFFYDVSGAPQPSAGPFDPTSAATGYPPPGCRGGVPPGGGYYPPAAGYPPSGYPPTPSTYGPYAYGAWAPPRNNGLAIAAMVLGIVGIVFCQLIAIPALFMGLIARKQIKESGGTQTGDAFALVGIILGGIAAALCAMLGVLYVALITMAASSGY